MLRVLVDSASSIKQDEKEKYDIEIIPLRYLMGDIEYRDGIDLSIDEFYNKLMEEKLFPKTSLPNLSELEDNVNEYVKQGDDVIIITLSSGISGTYSAISSMFQENDKVHVIDSLTAVGGIRILVEEINKYRSEPVGLVIEKIKNLIPKIKILAIPETLDYLFKGGRLSKKAWLMGKVFNIKPVITFVDGKVDVASKKIGLKGAMKYIADYINSNCDDNYSIVPSFTYNKENLEKLIEITDPKLIAKMVEFDNLDPVIACHWGPNAFGYLFVEK